MGDEDRRQLLRRRNVGNRLVDERLARGIKGRGGSVDN